MHRNVLETVERFFSNGDVFEVTGIGSGNLEKMPFTGIFDDFSRFEKASKDFAQYRNVYIGTNPLLPDMLAVANNRMRRAVNRPKDSSVLELRHFLIDFDPEKPAKGMSSSDEEKNEAYRLASVVDAYLQDMWGVVPAFCDSGNGYHLIFRIDMPNEKGSVEVLKRVLASLSAEFSTEKCSIDPKTFNPSRLTKLYGTIARKGDPVEGRPHRKSEILRFPEKFEPVPAGKLLEIAGKPESGANRASKGLQTRRSGDVDVEKTLGDLVKGTSSEGKTVRYYVDCPFSENHSTPTGSRDAAIFKNLDSGVVTFHCFHSGCGDRTWQDYKTAVGIGRSIVDEELSDEYASLVVDRSRQITVKTFEALCRARGFKLAFEGSSKKRRSRKQLHWFFVKTAAESGMSPQIAVDLIVHWDSENGYGSKVDEDPDEYRSTVRRAYESVATHGRLQEVAAGDGPDCDLAELSKLLGVEIEGVEEIVGAAAHERYCLRFSGDKFCFSGIEALDTFRGFRTAVADAVKVRLPAELKERFDAISSVLLASCVESRNDYEATKASAFEEVVERYLLNHSANILAEPGEENKSAACYAKLPFRNTLGEVYMHWGAFKAWAVENRAGSVFEKECNRMKRTAGFADSTPVRYRAGGGDRSVRMYRVPKQIAEQVLFRLREEYERYDGESMPEPDDDPIGWKEEET